jgi:hypothetical protein
VHADYHFEQYVSRHAFVRVHRRHALEDIKAAERILRGRACRSGVRRCDLYFAGILRRVAEQGRARRAAEIAARAEQRAVATAPSAFSRCWSARPSRSCL